MSDNKLQKLTEIFNDKFFRIPDFQRGYSWQKVQLEDFWEDLMNLKESRIHYTGLLTVEPIPEVKIQKDDLWLLDAGYTAYYLIDGQQRLTTSIILINEILNQFVNDENINHRKKSEWNNRFLFLSNKEDYKSYIFGYEHDNPSDEYFKTSILGQASSSADKVPETLYTYNLKRAKDFFKKKLGDYEGLEIGEIFKKLITGFRFNLYEIDNELDVYVTFETMNNRGKRLSNLELLKNRLIYLSTLLNVEDKTKEELRKDINETWKTIYEYLGKNKDNPMDDDEFLKNHWIMYFKYDRKESASYAKFLLNEKFTAQNAIKKEIVFADIKEYIDSLSKCIKSWFYLFNPQFSKYKDEIKEWIGKLNRLDMSAFPPLFMAAMTKCSEEELLQLFKSAERFIFLVFRLSQRRSNTENSYFYRLARSFYFGEELTMIESVIAKIGHKTDDDNEGWFDLKKFDSYIKDQYGKEEGFYTWNGLKYFLYEYELYLQQKAEGDRKISWIEFNKRKKEDTIEHIYPQTATDHCWTSVFDKYEEVEKKVLLHSLGNLVLLSRSKNSILQNKCFDLKKKDTGKDGNVIGFYNGSYSEIEVAGYDIWTPAEIEARGKKMLDFLDERWRVNIKSWEEKWRMKEGEFKENLLRNQAQERK